MASTVCAFCERHSHMTVHWAEPFQAQGGTNRAGTRAALQGAATCDNCGHASLGLSFDYSTSGNTHRDYFERTADQTFLWFPRVGAAPDFPDVPTHIERAAKEAYSSESIRSFMSAILMARTVVEATAKAKGITKGMLVAKIDELAKQGFIRSSTRDAAHEIRHFGNDMAHGDIEDIPDAEDVQDVLVLMSEILAEVFQGPARTARLMRKRNASKEQDD